MSRPYTIARLAGAAGVHVETILDYQRLRLVPESPDPLGGIRRYEADAERLRFIKRAQAMGSTLAKIVSLLDLQRRRRSCHATRELAAAKLGLVDARIRELRHLRKELASLIADCDANAEDNPCPVVQRLTQQPREAAGRAE